MNTYAKLDIALLISGICCALATSVGWYGTAVAEFILVLSFLVDRIVLAIKETK